jgi:ribosome-associated protein
MKIHEDSRIERIVEALQEKKGLEIILLDLRKLAYASDYFLICTGTSEQHVRSLTDEVRTQLSEFGEKPWHVEGADTRRWVLIDFVDIVVHIFRQEARDFYALERLWGDAERTEFEDNWQPEDEEKTRFEFSQF